ncbi:ABC transporter substrate-binding protein [Propionispora hippei]|uniref:NitT/TauT family transport system substrate-binding protein n=1 Tax=Propionispora hippei DSM 15287 TaxID=1123003 RepID=A0A1M6JDU6_9FIRM|nr:MetQ/NlpA family ABC transporter substrate-binding protein [Propionispora hippei]SHJ44762.1 NitT/TauT family transport system substrate-binding protein [Propionispora hippei DSM 15287]
MRKLIVVMLSIMLMLALAGCGAGPGGAAAGEQAGQTLTVGLMPDVDSIPFIIAQEKGFFKEEGVNVTLKSFKSAVDRDSALQSGNLDGAISDVLAEAFAKDGGFDTVITSATTGNYKLVAGKGEAVATLQDLRGKDVAISKNTIIEYVTDTIGTKGGLAADDMNKVIVPQIPARLEMLQNGKIAAATLPDPLATLAVKSGARLVSSSEQLGINPGVMLFTNKATETKAKEIAAMYRAYNKAIDYLAKEPRDSYIDLVIEKAGFPAAVKDSLELPQYKKAAAPAPADVEAVIAWLQQKQLIQKGYSYKELVNDRFVR